jgi:hypothetical protein
MKNKNTTVVIIPKYNRKIVERGKMDTTNTQICDWSPTWLGTDPSVKCDGVKLVFMCPNLPS